MSRGIQTPPGRGQSGQPTVATTKLDAILLSVDEVGTIMATNTLQPAPVSHNMSTGFDKFADPDCVGANSTAIKSVYDGTGWSAVRAQKMTGGHDPNNPHVDMYWVEQAVVSFPTANQASEFVNKSATQWKGCSGRVLTETDSAGVATWFYDGLSRDQNTLAQASFLEGGEGRECQHVLTSYGNLVLEASSCSLNITNEARRIVGEMVSKARA